MPNDKQLLFKIDVNIQVGCSRDDRYIATGERIRIGVHVSHDGAVWCERGGLIGTVYDRLCKPLAAMKAAAEVRWLRPGAKIQLPTCADAARPIARPAKQE